MEVFRESLHLDTLQTFPIAKVDVVQSTAMEGAERIFDQVSFYFSAVSLLTLSSVSRDTRDNIGGPLACCLTLLMLQSVGNKDVQGVHFTSNLLTSMIQWRHDPKLQSEEQVPLQWDAAVCNCLQIFAFVFGGTEESLHEAGVVPTTLVRTVLMILRSGKAPQKAAPFVFRNEAKCLLL